MFCKRCGLESETSDLCSWCRRPFSIPEVEPAVAAPALARAPEVSGVSADDTPPPAAHGSPAFEAPPLVQVRPPGPVLLADTDDRGDDLGPAPFAARPTPLPEEPPPPSRFVGAPLAAPIEHRPAPAQPSPLPMDRPDLATSPIPL